MRTKNLIIAASALVLAGFLVVTLRSRSAEDEDVSRQLSRAEQEVTVGTRQEPIQEQPESLSDSFSLTRRLQAVYHPFRGAWFVTARESPVSMKLPFVPPPSGTRMDDITEASSGESANPGFLGADACQHCHQEKHAGFVHTAHFKTSGVVGSAAMHGHFAGPQSTMKTKDPILSFQMRKEGDKYVQQVNFADYQLEFPLNVFTGSAKSGQTFLYWHEEQLFQAYVSYLTELDEWILSPGYSDRLVDYSRLIRTECLECHVTYIEQTETPSVYKPETAVWGISCERCHGPGREHVEYHQAHPDDKSAKFIVEPSDLPRQRQLDICAQCHSGLVTFVRGAFEFRPGNDIKKFHHVENSESEGVGGIHTSNQLTRLSMSRCFNESEMTCTTCHNPHVNQRGKREPFTASCLICHQTEHCGMSKKLGASIAENCVDCHMPMGDNEKLTLSVSSGSFTVQMIDHYIRVDEKAAAEFLSK